MSTAPNTWDLSSNSKGLPPSFTFRRQPMNGDETVALFPFAVPEWGREEKSTQVPERLQTPVFRHKHSLLMIRMHSDRTVNCHTST